MLFKKAFGFAIPQHRGGQQPLREPDVGVLEAYKKELPSHEWKFFDFSKNAACEVVAHPDSGSASKLVDQVDSSSSSSEDESETQSSDDEPASKRVCMNLSNDLGTLDEVLVAFSSNTQHGMVQSSDSQFIAYGDSFRKPACGAFLNPDRVQFSQEPSPDRHLCRRKACAKIWARLS